MKDDAANELPVFWAHGTADTMIPYVRFTFLHEFDFLQTASEKRNTDRRFILKKGSQQVKKLQKH